MRWRTSTGDLDGGIAMLDRALFLNPNLASAWFLGGFLRTWHGECEERHQALRAGHAFEPGRSRALSHAGRHRDGASVSPAGSRRRRRGQSRSYSNLPSFLMVVALIAATRALGGRQEDARRAIEEVRALDPTLRVSNVTDWLPISRPEHLAIFTDGLRKAGLPE